MRSTASSKESRSLGTGYAQTAAAGLLVALAMVTSAGAGRAQYRAPTERSKPPAPNHSGWGLGLTGGTLFVLGDNTEKYNPGAWSAWSAEYRVGDYFGIAAESGFVYLYAENEDLMPYFGYWVTNYMWMTQLQPRLYLPASERFDFVVSGGLGYTHVWTEVDYYAYIVPATEISEDVHQTLDVFTFETGVGGLFSVSPKMDVGLEVVYNPMNFTGPSDIESRESISVDKMSFDDDKVQVQAVKLRTRFMYRF